MKAAVERTHGPAVLGGLGSFGGAFSGAAIKAMDDPVLVASTDGVGTKVELAARLGRYRGVGADIVNHCINDVLVQGARPLFFLDYVASSQIHADRVAEVVTGMAEACAASGCALLGGETAEMPGVYAEGAFDIAGTLVGVVERRDLLPTADVGAGDVLIGIASNGPHTNGYSLLRKVFDWLPMDATPPGFDRAARRHAARAAPQLPAGAREGAGRRPRQGAGAHHRRRPARQPAAGAARQLRRRRPARLVAGAAAVRAGARGVHRPRRPRAVPHAQHGHRHGRRVRTRPCRRRAGRDRRDDVGHRLAGPRRRHRAAASPDA